MFRVPFPTLQYSVISILSYLFSYCRCQTNVNFSPPQKKSALFWDLRRLPAQKARCTQMQWLFSSSVPPPPSLLSASHTAYPATFGTSFSLLGFSHLGHWHKINEDTKKTQGSELEGVGGWGVKLLGCKIALAAVLLFQHFMASCSASVATCSVPSSLHLFFTCFSAHAVPLLEFGPLSVETVNFSKNTAMTIAAD